MGDQCKHIRGFDTICRCSDACLAIPAQLLAEELEQSSNDQPILGSQDAEFSNITLGLLHVIANHPNSSDVLVIYVILYTLGEATDCPQQGCGRMCF